MCPIGEPDQGPKADGTVATAPPATARALDASEPVTPMMAQYLAVKAEHPDCLLFYRMGDFYELFFDDAVQAAAALDITLTQRGRHQGQDIKMCGVPIASHEGYLARLIRKGFKVAVCEQLEDPAAARKRSGKAVIRRDVVRVITAGTLTEDALLEPRAPNYLAAIASAAGGLGLAWLDVSTGDLLAQAVADGGLAAALARLEPSEILAADVLRDQPRLGEHLAAWRARITELPASRFDSLGGERRLTALFGVGTLAAFGAFSRAEIAAMGALVDYVALTQRGRLPRIQRPARLGEGAIMEIDGASRRNLELTATLAGERSGSLIDVIDRTVTGAGGRLLLARLAAPLTDVARINARLDAVQFFVDDDRARADVRRHLRGCPDLERALARLCVGRGGPRDLAAIRDGLGLIPAILAAIGGSGLMAPPPALAQRIAQLGRHDALAGELGQALAAAPPVATRDGGFIANGYSAPLDEARALRDDGRRLIAALEARYQKETGLGALKIRYNALLGYFIEVPAAKAERLPAAPNGPFIHRQTMANAMRFSSVELAELEGRMARAGEDALALEMKLFEQLAGQVAAAADTIASAARALAALDVAAGLAELACARRYCRPEVGATLAFSIEGGRHPVVETALAAAQARPFVANDCTIEDAQRLWLLTGPNMAGKSTFLRQNALIAILAQIGSYVPATRARIGVVDRLFSRVGAADDLARGRSTFMVEMVETAAILNQAGGRALVILDEIGRGTATFDGLSIAWAVIEHLHDVNRCRGLFATHYHELTALAARLDHLACYTMRSKEWRGDVVFLHEVVAGAADRSYGIHVGRMAGLPDTVVARAQEVLAQLEQDGRSAAAARLACDLPLFAARATPPPPPQPSPVEAALLAVNPDSLSPRQALDTLYALHALLAEQPPAGRSRGR